MKEKDEEYVVYDQFHWMWDDHIEYIFKGWEYALANYNFLKQSYPKESLALTTKKEYMKMIDVMYGSYENYQKVKQEHKLNIKNQKL